MLVALQIENNSRMWEMMVGLGVALAAIIGFGLYMLRRFFEGTRKSAEQELHNTPRTENASAFMAASMQGVIVKLREQERELERLHKIEKERAEKTERLSEEVTRNMPAGLLIVNATGIISSANPAAEQALGIRGLGFRRHSEALGAAAELPELIAECLRTGKIFRREQVKHVTPAGELRHLGVTISPIRRGEETISGVLCLLSDLTEVANLQQQMQLKENLAALGELSAGIAHEFKNALATISGYAQMIRAEPQGQEAADNAERILEQTRNITHVVTEFLKYARPLDISTETVVLQPLVEKVVSEIEDGSPQLHIRSEGSFGSVAGDEGLLRQALLNLVRNAAEACGEAANGPRVLLRGEIVPGEQSAVQRLCIYDNGPGIPREVQENLFRPFFTTKANGTGLGLAVVQKIIVQHGGQVEARNRAEGGAAFIVTLPLCTGPREGVELGMGAQKS
ncbi:MAG TPA: ATP-binding protein [Candidatus Dormibacteraeota bacterium]|nr:ATP-binding protein [Candidatus Dormibacteraeota bacterium]